METLFDYLFKYFKFLFVTEIIFIPRHVHCIVPDKKKIYNMQHRHSSQAPLETLYRSTGAFYKSHFCTPPSINSVLTPPIIGQRNAAALAATMKFTPFFCFASPVCSIILYKFILLFVPITKFLHRTLLMQVAFASRSCNDLALHFFFSLFEHIVQNLPSALHI